MRNNNNYLSNCIKFSCFIITLCTINACVVHEYKNGVLVSSRPITELFNSDYTKNATQPPPEATSVKNQEPTPEPRNEQTPEEHVSTPTISKAPISNTGTVKPVTATIARNSKLALNLGEGMTGEFGFSDGSYESGKIGDPGSESICSAIVKMAFGDLNRDKNQDAAIITSTNTGGSGIFYSICALIASRGYPVSTNAIYLGDRTIIKSMKIKSGRIDLKVITAGPNDPSCCPTMKKTLAFRFLKDKLVQVRN